MSRRPETQSIAAGLALGGLFAGHAVTYAWLVPEAHARDAVLGATGHGYLAFAGRLGLIAAVAALTAATVGGVLRRDGGPRSTVARLAALQVAAFIALEVGERLVTGGPLHDLATVLPVGLVVQVAVAVAIGLATFALTRVVERAAAVAANAAPTRPRLILVPTSLPSAHHLAGVDLTVAAGRAPPPPSG